MALAADPLRAQQEAAALCRADAEQLRLNLTFGAGVLFGAGYPGASAAALVALEQLFGMDALPTTFGPL